MKNPCNECIVEIMCENSCDKFASYFGYILVSKGISSYGPANHSLCCWLRLSINRERYFPRISLGVNSATRYSYDVEIDGGKRRMSLVEYDEDGKQVGKEEI